MPLLDRLGPELRDRVPRVDALRTPLIAEVAARAVPDAVLVVVVVQARDIGLIPGIADEAHSLGERGRAEELRIGLHRVALGDAAAAHDAERLFVDHVHLLLRDDALLLERLLVARIEPRLHPSDLPPEGIHVDDEILDHRHVPHRRDHRHVTGLRDVVHARLAGKDGGTVHAHAAGAADHHPAALAIRERAVVLVLDDVEHVEERHPVGRLDLVALQLLLTGLRVVAPDLQRDVDRRRSWCRGEIGVH